MVHWVKQYTCNATTVTKIFLKLFCEFWVYEKKIGRHESTPLCAGSESASFDSGVGTPVPHKTSRCLVLLIAYHAQTTSHASSQGLQKVLQLGLYSRWSCRQSWYRSVISVGDVRVSPGSRESSRVSVWVGVDHVRVGRRSGLPHRASAGGAPYQSRTCTT